MDVLVIGGSYFNGRALVQGFLKDGHRVAVLNRGTHRLDGVEQLVADRNIPEQVQQALQGRSFDWVVDTSCYTPDQSWIALGALKERFCHWVHLSSAAVYVEDGTIPMDENHPTGRSPAWGEYGELKWYADEFLLEQARENELPVTIIRPPYTYGPGNNLEREIFFWSRLLRGRPILLPDSGNTPIQFLHVEDLYGFIRLALAYPDRSAGQVFNLAERKAITFKALVELLASVAGAEAVLVPVAYQSLGLKPRDFFPFRDYPYVLDVRKAETILEWSPQYDLRAGLLQTFASYDPHWLATRVIDTEIEDRILGEVTRLTSSEARTEAKITERTQMNTSVEKAIRHNVDSLRSNPYPGRGIIIGKSPNSKYYVQVYWIMGRSENSRNRIFVVENGFVKTEAFDPKKVTDPSRIIYYPVKSIGACHIVTNGDQTDTILNALSNGDTFGNALASRTFEPDPPNYTPRISGLIDLDDKKNAYKLSILKSVVNDPSCCVRQFYDYETALDGVGHCITTYSGDGNPLPSFDRDPYVVNLFDDMDETAQYYWNILNQDNKVSLLVKFINVQTRQFDIRIVNKNS